MEELIKNNKAYVIWFLLYIITFSLITGGIALYFYVPAIILAIMPDAEVIWRIVVGVRPLRLKSEKERLLPLFKEVYLKAYSTNPNISKRIKLFIKEDMTVNAFAFGRCTMVITRGSIELLNDECLKGLMAHEFGHFASKHTEAVLLFTVANLPMSFIMRKLTNAKNKFDQSKNRRSVIVGGFRMIVDTLYYIFKSIDFIGEIILMSSSRKSEYIADSFAVKAGVGKELCDVLTEIYKVSIEKPQSVREQFRSTHPHITLRIEQLEKVA